MTTWAFNEVLPKKDGFAENSSRDHPAESWAPPLAPIGTPAPADAGVSVRQRALYADDDPPQPPEQSDLSEIETSFRSRRTLVAGSAIVATLGVCALAYFFLASAGEKTPTQTAELAPAVQSPPAALVQAGPSLPEPSPAPPAAAAWPDAPASIAPARPVLPVEDSPQVTPAAPPGNTAARQTVPGSQNRDVLFLQRPGVNIRSTPSATGSVLGTAPKGTRFEVRNREGDWIQVESGRLKGWINARFLAPNEPR